MIRPNQTGFTLVELLLALALFGFVLVFAVSGFVQVNRSYNKGITVKRVQETGRAVIEDIARSLRLAGDPGSVRVCDVDDQQGCSGNFRLCLPGVRYGWSDGSTGEEFTSAGDIKKNWLVRSDTASGCNSAFSQAEAESFLEDDLIVQELNITWLIGTSAYKIDLTLSTGDTTLITNSGKRCKGAAQVSGSQYCDVVNLSTTVTIR